nr:hypothetical protein [Clostridia bacterium]
NLSIMNNSPVCVAGFVALSMTSLSPVVLAIESVVASFLTGGTELLISTAVAVTVLAVIFAVYRLKRTRPAYELIIYVLASLSYYVFALGGSFYERAILALLITVLSFMMIAVCNYLITKGLKYRPTGEEFVMFTVTAVCVGLGFLRLVTPAVAKPVFILILLVATRIMPDSSMMLSVVLSLPFAVYYSDAGYLSAFVLISTVINLTASVSHYVAGLLAIATDYALYAVFGIYPAYSLTDFFMLLGGVLIFFVTPNSFYEMLKDKFSAFKTHTIVKRTINRSRNAMSEKLYDLSEVFREISDSFEEFKRNAISPEQATEMISAETFKSTCLNCNNRWRCVEKRTEQDLKSDVFKLVEIGMAKGKISFIDLPKSFADGCFESNSVIYSVNKQLADYRETVIDNENFALSRELIAKQAEGVAEMLKKLALK